MAATYTRQKKPGKGKSSLAITYKGFFGLPDCVMNHPDFIAMSGTAAKLLLDIGAQFNGRNNGDLQCTRSIMSSRGWTSDSTRTRALTELIKLGLLVQTKVGGRGIGPNLYAITWQPIHECGGKLDVSPTGSKPYRDFRE
ncbi:hypothetical protein [Marinobacterium aestuariivivens]|uniref:Uncharacterized protein n=1 Tax=Marinobacterium aestuariivivens TaxID=1698799 RepID=A0ABW2A5G1_9GAMM